MAAISDVSLTARRIELTLRTPFRLSRGSSATRTNVLAELAAGGIVGRGEAAPIARYRESADSAAAALDAMAAALAGNAELPETPAAIARTVARVAPDRERAARAALEVALLDRAARLDGVALHELLGVERKPLAPTSITIGLDPLDEAVAKARAAGEFEVLKIKMGAPGDVERVEAVRAVASHAIRVDANEGWSFDEAPDKLARLAGLGVELVEQPLPAGRLEETRALRAHTRLPLVADEDVHVAKDVPRLVGVYDGVNVKLAKCGGVTEALRLIAAARDHGLKVLLGCMIESSVGIAAALAISPLVDWIDLDGHLLVSNDPFDGIPFARGRLEIPSGPGLGVELRISASGRSVA